MIHLISNQVLYEPVFCALSCGVFISTWSVPYPTLSISTIQFHPNPTQSILKCSNFPKLLIIGPLICENYPPLKLIKNWSSVRRGRPLSFDVPWVRCPGFCDTHLIDSGWTLHSCLLSIRGWAVRYLGVGTPPGKNGFPSIPTQLAIGRAGRPHKSGNT